MTNENIKAALETLKNVENYLRISLRKDDQGLPEINRDFPVIRTLLEAQTSAASQQTRGEVHDRRDQVCEEICRIMKEYDRQISVRGYVDTPGGLENMGDVWNLLRSWQYLLTPPVAGKDRGEQK